jgi:hypothetical protein
MGFIQPKAMANVVKLPKNVPIDITAGSTTTIASAVVLFAAQRASGTTSEQTQSTAETNAFNGNGSTKNKTVPITANKIRPPRVNHHHIVVLPSKEMAIF